MELKMEVGRVFCIYSLHNKRQNTFYPGNIDFLFLPGYNW
jgi:hypothetical protein